MISVYKTTLVNPLYTGFTSRDLFFNLWINKTYPRCSSLGFSCSKLHTKVKPAIPSKFANLAMPTRYRVFAQAMPTRSSATKSHGHMKWRPYKVTGLLPTSIHAKNKKNGLPSSEQGLSTARPRLHYAIFTLRVNPPSSPHPTLSAHAEPISRENFPK